MKKLALLLSVCAIMSTSAAWAEPFNDLTGKFGVYGNVGYSSYVMKDMNDGIDDFNNNFVIGAGMKKVDHITGGMNYGGGVQYGISKYLFAGVEFNYLTAQYKDDNEGRFWATPTYYIDDWKTTTSFPLIEVGPVVKGALPIGDIILLTGGVNVNYLSMSGKTETPDIGYSSTFTGSGVGVKLMVGGEVFLTSFLSLGVDVGYRFAVIGEIKNQDGSTAKNADGSNATADYSGVFGRGGIRAYF